MPRNIALNDLFSLAKISADDTCEEGRIEIPNSKDDSGASGHISFTCHGKKAGLVEAMRQGLKNTAEQSDMFCQKSHQPKRVSDPCKSGRDTYIGGWVTSDTVFYDETYVPQALTVLVNYERGADLGNMRYKLACPIQGGNCV